MRLGKHAVIEPITSISPPDGPNIRFTDLHGASIVMTVASVARLYSVIAIEAERRGENLEEYLDRMVAVEEANFSLRRN